MRGPFVLSLLLRLVLALEKHTPHEGKCIGKRRHGAHEELIIEQVMCCLLSDVANYELVS